ncbi:cation diffusion facilitator family transporter [Colwellia sp. 4_MG-2023]|uniref:cation diffusion facilitator family transporter n=1 Tax=unclassified Colwellia TaxID=196834 RepID=UPI001C0A613A|nr:MULTISPECIES: cation diffusion facilitator family transporter [unclassified Colwellia]MBU2924107.1 cation diffusion facilitator family transporter [Colwellia sp. C2M11]MDO6506141.1 cation diffusion facilitator family transporter [Colwellia sp. 5_MG-2023]MDO6554799.1 cation diffusion facilitator family transporter [Colwellia sp. 4_MG-2023]MDO6651998.1 cation diffusion facilitator family transporter [Colwellia sp. 3_MG-2023]MDO6664774.1 cation diffusion facilitator family transporter [Colwell
MGHNHSHGHSHSHSHDGKLSLAVFINILLSVAQVVGGIVSGSLSLIADALHNLSDAGAIIIAIVARKIARKPANSNMTYGFERAEILGALINSTTLLLVGVYLIFESIAKYFNPEPIDGWIVVWIATIALIIDAATAWLTYKAGAKNNLNLRAAFIHNMSDAFASIVVILAGTLIILYQWYVVDLIATIGISIYVIYHGLLLTKQTIKILMQAVPEDIDIDELCGEIEGIPSIKKINHIHVWQLDDNKKFLEAHVALEIDHIDNGVVEIKKILLNNYGIKHSTIEICLDAQELANNCYQRE